MKKYADLNSGALLESVEHQTYTTIQRKNEFDGYKFHGLHFKAIIFRRWTLIKRSKKMVAVTFSMTLFFTMLAILAHFLMETLLQEFRFDMNFKLLCDQDNEIVLSFDDDMDKHLPYVEALAAIYRNDTGREPRFHNETSLKAVNEFMYKRAVDNPNHIPYVSMGVSFNDYYPFLNMTVLHNTSTLIEVDLAARVVATRMAWKKKYGMDTDFKFSVTLLLKHIVDVLFAQLGPAITTVGLISIIPLLITQPIIDIRGEVRQYMVASTLSLPPYWLATFLIDIVIWVLVTVIMWAIFLLFKIRAFMDNQFATLYLMISIGPAFILFSYCISFAFSQAESASRQLFVILCIILVIPIIVDFARFNFVDPVWLDYCYGLLPHLLLQRQFALLFQHISFLKQPFTYFWKVDPNTRAFFIMTYVDIPVYIIVLWMIETLGLKIGRRKSINTFSKYIDFFKDQKKKHPVTKEAQDLANLAYSTDNNEKIAVSIRDVSKLYFNTEGFPISAVNNVSLGVKEGSLFGFLGANGAGKTTLIKMITSMTPPSSGTIEINGQDISKVHDPTVLSVCPQFNSHLCYEMTPREHFKLYRMIHRFDPKEAEYLSNNLMEMLDLTKYADKPVRELSGGNMRKLAVALAFYSQSNIILLDEPTSSLDPVARHDVHELIQAYRGQKTFMLCTHLLSEAEALCDVISIMIKGCVYTYGTPQYLSQKFGTEYKVDIMLDDDSEETLIKVDNFFSNELPLADLTISRPKARIYSIPASMITLPELFIKMGTGKKGDHGFCYYTCSSSSLERVFMEIVKISELADINGEGMDIVSTTLQSSHSDAVSERKLPSI
ncbi:ABC transporter family protein [Tritrichomonas foetus]|uniref:ABC transporter family protein n=1 Tax=Tritrichomonas foetus TaxID=1144522 RepID=A0A1J4JC33_9EUKA|nr:ABC transporter family protein [Tritrichomonas foetus]|eukprot:OHS94973.1 ABC transporter family protein [Tritrichomonas foetus]